MECDPTHSLENPNGVVFSARSKLVSFPDHLSSACIASGILKAIHVGVGWVWDRD